ncbi:hypothetical protein WA171_004359 [Blastocystis sp. BT1]
MRFHATIRVQFFETFVSTINSLASISETICFHISMNGIMTCSMQADHTFSAYTEFKLDMFDNYLSESNTDNHIYIVFKTQSFTKAMKNTKSVKSVNMKLSCYRGLPGLLFDMEMVDGINIRQDINVNVLQQQEFSIYDEPSVTPPSLKLCVRKAKELRVVLSRMKIVDKTVKIEANNQGTLKVSSNNVAVLMETTFSSVFAVDTDMTTVISIRMRIEIKSLMKALASIQSEPRAIHFCFNEVAMIIYVIMKRSVGSVTYYIPGQIMDDSFVYYYQEFILESILPFVFQGHRKK